MAKGGFDYSEFTDFTKSLTEAKVEFMSWLYDFVAEIAQRTLALTKERQVFVEAVDTGNMLNAWTIEDITLGADKISFTIFNGMDYASYVEYGHTSRGGNWVNGRYIVTIAIEEIQKQIPKRFEKSFQQFMKGKGIG